MLAQTLETLPQGEAHLTWVGDSGETTGHYRISESSSDGHAQELQRQGHTTLSMAMAMVKPVKRCTHWGWEVREQDLQRASTSAQKAYFEVEGRPGSQPDPRPPTESGQGSPEPVRTAEVRQRCDTQQVNSVTRRERHPVTAESDTPVLFPAC